MSYIPKFFAIISFVLICGLGGYQSVVSAAIPSKIVINIPSRTLSVYEDGRVLKEYSVGIGKASNQTPLGKFQIYYKEINPTWVESTPEGEPLTIASGPDNPLGYRWMEFSPTYGIHGTDQPDSIGGFVSHGCVRMLERDVEEIYDDVPLGLPVEITYDRVLLKKSADKSLVLYIYPDNYALLTLTPEDVYKKLATYNAVDLVARGDIVAALCSTNTSEINLGRVFALNIFGKKLTAVGYYSDGIAYIPVNPLVVEAKTAVNWDAASGFLTSAFGSVPGIVRNDRLYVARADLYNLFHLYGNWHDSGAVMSLGREPEN